MLLFRVISRIARATQINPVFKKKKKHKNKTKKKEEKIKKKKKETMLPSSVELQPGHRCVW